MSLFSAPKTPKETAVYVKINGITEKYIVGTGDYLEARMELINHLNQGFRPHGAVLALVN